jgi:hypothetical protein
VTLLARSFPGARNRVERDGYRIVRAGNTATMQWEARRYYGLRAAELDGVVEFVNALLFLTPLYVRGTAAAVFYQTAEEVWRHEPPGPLASIGCHAEPLCLHCYRGVPVLAISESTRTSLGRFGVRDVDLVRSGRTTLSIARHCRRRSRSRPCCSLGPN